MKITIIDYIKPSYYSFVTHRINGPSFMSLTGYACYYKHGKPHRENGPARIYSNGTLAYYTEGKHIKHDYTLYKK